MMQHLKTATFAVALTWAWAANAQGTLETDNPFRLDQPVVFTAHLTGISGYTGDGTFSLTGNILTYRVQTEFGFDVAGIYGPALPGVEGPLIFTLPLSICIAPPPGGGGTVRP